jgi:16S rRNA (guanine527-N7)-methyltransferase
MSCGPGITELPDVSRETSDALQAFEALVRRWNPAINLVSKASLDNIHDRHPVDSMQIYSFLPESAKLWVDLGSGGGFPGLVIAVMARADRPNLQIVLVESDARKATFLRQAAQTLDLKVHVLNERSESLPAQQADVLSARALAPLTALLGHAERHLRPGGLGIFPKGERYAEEIAVAEKTWSFALTTQPSLSEPGSAILMIRDIHRASKD